jgi:hypothetical protein
VRQRQIELPSIESLPQETCKQCGRSLIRGLFTPVELEGRYPDSPRCRTCIGEINERPKPEARHLEGAKMQPNNAGRATAR